MFRKTILTIAVAAVAATATASTGSANSLRGDGLALIWMTVNAYPGEGRWEACRRVYQRDVYHVRAGHGHTVRCHVDHSRMND